ALDLGKEGTEPALELLEPCRLERRDRRLERLPCRSQVALLELGIAEETLCGGGVERVPRALEAATTGGEAGVDPANRGLELADAPRRVEARVLELLADRVRLGHGRQRLVPAPQGILVEADRPQRLSPPPALAGAREERDRLASAGDRGREAARHEAVASQHVERLALGGQVAGLACPGTGAQRRLLGRPPVAQVAVVEGEPELDGTGQRGVVDRRQPPVMARQQVERLAEAGKRQQRGGDPGPDL